MHTKQAAAKRNSASNRYFLRLIGLIICLAAAISIVVTILNLTSMGLNIASRIFLIALLIDAALVALPFYLIWSGKNDYSNFARFGCIALAGLMLILNLFVSSNLSATSDFLNEQYSGAQGGIEYTVVAQRSAGVQLSTSQSIRAGIQSTDICKEEVEQETQKIAPATFTEYSNLSELIGATEEDTVDIAVVQSVMLSAYAEYFPAAYDGLDILTTFTAGSEERAPVSNAKIDITKPFVIYVSGSDIEGDITQTSRSDANMLVLINPETYRVLLINTPRDYYVQLHDTTGAPDKLTHAGTYGIEMSERTLEDLYGLEINYHVRINYDTLANLVDSFGGLTLINPKTFTFWGQTYEEGPLWLNGDMAVLYARARSPLADGDNSRGENQQRVIEAIIATLTDPTVVVHYRDILDAMSGTFLSNIPPSIITQLFMRQISIGGSWSIDKMSATGTNAQKPTYSMGSKELSVIVPDETSLAEIRAAINGFMKSDTAGQSAAGQ